MFDASQDPVDKILVLAPGNISFELQCRPYVCATAREQGAAVAAVLVAALGVLVLTQSGVECTELAQTANKAANLPAVTG